MSTATDPSLTYPSQALSSKIYQAVFQAYFVILKMLIIGVERDNPDILEVIRLDRREPTPEQYTMFCRQWPQRSIKDLLRAVFVKPIREGTIQIDLRPVHGDVTRCDVAYISIGGLGASCSYVDRHGQWVQFIDTTATQISVAQTSPAKGVDYLVLSISKECDGWICGDDLCLLENSWLSKRCECVRTVEGGLQRYQLQCVRPIGLPSALAGDARRLWTCICGYRLCNQLTSCCVCSVKRDSICTCPKCNHRYTGCRDCKSVPCVCGCPECAIPKCKGCGAKTSGLVCDDCVLCRTHFVWHPSRGRCCKCTDERAAAAAAAAAEFTAAVAAAGLGDEIVAAVEGRQCAICTLLNPVDGVLCEACETPL